jgi:hypothetical protein
MSQLSDDVFLFLFRGHGMLNLQEHSALDTHQSVSRVDGETLPALYGSETGLFPRFFFLEPLQLEQWLLEISSG